MNRLFLSLCLAAALAACAGGGYHGTREGRLKEVAAIQTRLALAYMQAGDLRQAVATIDEAIRSDSRSEEAWLVRGQIFQLIQNREEAGRSLRQVLQINPASAEGNNNYGWFLCSMNNQPAESLPYFERALADRTYPEPYVAHLNSGICLSKTGDYGGAQRHFAAALQAAPWFAAAAKESARSFYQAGDFAAASRQYGIFRSRINKPSADDIFLGWQIARSSGERSAAADYARELAAAHPYAEELKTIHTQQAGAVALP